MKILFVCTGNTCRSPMAEYLLKDKLEKAGIDNVEVFSRGINVLDEKISQQTISALKTKGIVNVEHTATIISKQDVESSDYIFTMSDRQKNVVNNYYRTDKAVCISELTSLGEVVDPYGKDFDAYIYVLKTLDKATDYIMENIVKKV